MYICRDVHGYAGMTEKEKLIYAAKARVLKALAHPTRLWIVEELAAGERCVCEFADVVDVDPFNYFQTPDAVEAGGDCGG